MTLAGDAADSIPARWRNAGIAIAFGAILVTACGTTSSVYLAGAGLANFIYTDKLPTDYIAEIASGQECSFLKAQKDGGPLCRESFERVVYERPIYCYRSLGEISCYDKLDPYGRNSNRVQ